MRLNEAAFGNVISPLGTFGGDVAEKAVENVQESAQAIIYSAQQGDPEAQFTMKHIEYAFSTKDKAALPENDVIAREIGSLGILGWLAQTSKPNAKRFIDIQRERHFSLQTAILRDREHCIRCILDSTADTGMDVVLPQGVSSEIARTLLPVSYFAIDSIIGGLHAAAAMCNGENGSVKWVALTNLYDDKVNHVGVTTQVETVAHEAIHAVGYEGWKGFSYGLSQVGQDTILLEEAMAAHVASSIMYGEFTVLNPNERGGLSVYAGEREIIALLCTGMDPSLLLEAQFSTIDQPHPKARRALEARLNSRVSQLLPEYGEGGFYALCRAYSQTPRYSRVEFTETTADNILRAIGADAEVLRGIEAAPPDWPVFKLVNTQVDATQI